MERISCWVDEATANLIAVALVLVGLLTGNLAGNSRAAPVKPGRSLHALAQSTPDWMSADSAAQLAVGIDVLVPWSLPAPFSGEPQISASSGYYSLYWFIGGGSPTLLQIIGEAGGTIPAYSKYDRNVELVANATVNGVTAYHDQTPIYDLVYWQIGNVVYSVESQNSSVDSLTIANGLAAISPPVGSPGLTGSLTSPDQVTAGDSADVNVTASGDATLITDVGYFTDTGESSIAISGSVSVGWQSPNLTEPVTATFQLLDPTDGSVVASTPTQILVEDSSSNQQSLDWGLDCPTQGAEGETVSISVQGPSRATLSASDGGFSGGLQAIIVNLGEAVDVDLKLPFNSSGVVRLTLSDGESPLRRAKSKLLRTTTSSRRRHRPNYPTASSPETAPTSRSRPARSPPYRLISRRPLRSRPKCRARSEGDGTGIIEAARVTPPAVLPTATPTNTPKPGEPTSTPVPTDTPVPTATSTPENPIPTMVPQVSDDGQLVALEIGPAGDTLSSPYGVQINVPEGTFQDMTSVTLQPVADSQVPLQAAVRLVPESAFDISFAQMNGRAMSLGDKSATVSVDLSQRWTNGATAYELVNGQAVEIKGVSTEGRCSSSTSTGQCA